MSDVNNLLVSCFSAHHKGVAFSMRLFTVIRRMKNPSLMGDPWCRKGLTIRNEDLANIRANEAKWKLHATFETWYPCFVHLRFCNKDHATGGGVIVREFVGQFGWSAKGFCTSSSFCVKKGRSFVSETKTGREGRFPIRWNIFLR